MEEQQTGASRQTWKQHPNNPLRQEAAE